ncbi:zf-HC2 domain-containing protein [Marinactinospora rubrisoli]|uniref:Zf-HC2 domain-containing protein n=1 Tax=Marinactinospora rubrisoli TaxID=2715399 RepID=A0ABW2KFI9_9ACTN
MKCVDCRTAVSAELDGEDPGRPAEEVRDHLESCARCARWQAAARDLRPLIRGLRPAAVQRPGGDE